MKYRRKNCGGIFIEMYLNRAQHAAQESKRQIEFYIEIKNLTVTHHLIGMSVSE
ncbi:hypothetical protein ACFLYP_00715 [Chloroflexota bacterium]